MKRILSVIFHAPWYFANLAAYPGLALLSNNIYEVRYDAGIRAILLSMAVAIFLTLIARWLYRSWHRAAFVVSSLTILFFSYGHIYNYLRGKLKAPYLLWGMFGGWVILSILVLVLAGNRKIHYKKATFVLNIVSLGLVLILSVQITWWSLPRVNNGIADENAPITSLEVPSGKQPVDIYYIIVDSYGRSDLLSQSFDIDNSSFIQSLEQMGFYIANCSQSNYNRTDVSLASSLNMDYLQNLDDSYRSGSQDRSKLWASIKDSTLRYELTNAGYKTVAFSTGFAWTEMTNADMYLAPTPGWTEMTGFETMLIRSTPLLHLEDAGWINYDDIDGQRYRERTQLVFNSMSEVARIPGPKFVFIHIIPPHPPFVYEPDGNPTDPGKFLNQDNLYEAGSYSEGYRNQVPYIDGKLVSALSTILAESAQPPVIVLQGDHAPWMQTGSNQFKILNAYYLPGKNALLYPTISPVNTFRLILDTYLGADYSLIDDVSFTSQVPDIYNFVKTDNPCLTH